MTSLVTTTTEAPIAADAHVALSRSQARAMALVGGATMLALARLLTNEGGTPAQRLHQVGAHPTQISVSVLLAVGGFAALIAGFGGVADAVAAQRTRGERVAAVGAALTLLGCVGFSVLAAIDGIPTVAAAHVGDTGVMASYLHQLDSSGALSVIGPIAVLGYFVGPFLVALGARRAALVPAWVPWTVLAAMVLQPVGLAVSGPGAAKQALDVACQLVLVVATVVLARQTLQQRPSASA